MWKYPIPLYNSAFVKLHNCIIAQYYGALNAVRPARSAACAETKGDVISAQKKTALSDGF